MNDELPELTPEYQPSAELEARITRIEDFQAITNLQAEYSFLVDSSRHEQLVELFIDDLIWEVGFDQMIRVTSKPDLLEFLNKTGRATTMMRHHPVTPYIDIDGNTATASWYLIGMLTAKSPRGEEANWVHGNYDNSYVKEGDKWKIRHLRFTYTFVTPYDKGWVETPVSSFWA